jgi:CheY-like chemotaxis protein
MADVSLRILIAEDEPQHLAFLERVCLEHGHQVTTVSDGQACLEALGHGRYDLLFLDLIMPVVNGTEVLRQMRAMTGKALPRVVIVSSEDDELAIEESVRLGATVYLTKPVPAATVSKVLNQIVLRATISGAV